MRNYLISAAESAPQFFADCPDCNCGVIPKRVTVYEGGGWYYDTDEQPCPECGGTGTVETGWEPDYHNCTMGVGCDEVGVCYAETQNHPEQCPSYPRTKP